MSWKTINGRRYYYRSKRREGRVVSQYLGGESAGNLFYLLDLEDRAERADARLSERDERERLEAEDRDVDEWCENVEAVTRATLEAAGYHRHHRGEWRKRRGRNSGHESAMDQGAIGGRSASRQGVARIENSSYPGDV
jgi:hypothetical protein